MPTREKDLQARLTRARSYLAIAESKDARREAYEQAADEIRAYMQETGVTVGQVAKDIGYGVDALRRVLKWRESGADGMPFEKSATTATKAHARRMLRERPEEIAPEIAKAMEDPDVREAVAEHVSKAAAAALNDAAKAKGLPDVTDVHRKAKEAEQPPSEYTQWSTAEASLMKARLVMEEALRHVREVEWTPEFAEFLEGDIAKIEHITKLARLAVTGNIEIDWDAEFASFKG